MLANLRPLILGFTTGVLIAAILIQQLLILPLSDPMHDTAQDSSGSNIPCSPYLLHHMAYSLRNPLQIARQAILRGGQYKNARSASSSLQETTRSSFPKSTSSLSSSNAFSTSTPRMSSTKSFVEAAKDRRSIYQLNKNAPIPDSKIIELVNTAGHIIPSSFNSQSTRLVTLLNEEHEAFWDQVIEVMKPIVPEESWAASKGRLDGFKAGYGTILFFIDPEPLDSLRKAMPLYSQHYDDWAEQSNAMHQFFLWTALEAEGFGANLQHYNPIVDRKAQEHYKIPLEWKLRAQLVFGGRAGEMPAPKEKLPLEKIVFVHGAKE